MGLFKRMFGREEEVDPILGGLGGPSEPSGLEARPVESGFASTPAPAPSAAPDPPDMSNPLDMFKMARELQHLQGDPAQMMAQLQQLFPGAQIGVQQQRAGDEQDDQLAQLERLAALHQRGALSDAEFAAAKAKLLGAG